LYEQSPDPWQHALARRTLGNFLVAEAISPLVAASSCIDIGCGTGDLVALLNDNEATVFGYDISRKAIDIAEARWPRLKQQFATELPNIDGRQTVVLVMKDVDYYNSPDFAWSVCNRYKNNRGLYLLVVRSGPAPKGRWPIIPSGFELPLSLSIRGAALTADIALKWIKVR